jgi:hypothetical protein
MTQAAVGLKRPIFPLYTQLAKTPGTQWYAGSKTRWYSNPTNQRSLQSCKRCNITNIQNITIESSSFVGTKL